MKILVLSKLLASRKFQLGAKLGKETTSGSIFIQLWEVLNHLATAKRRIPAPLPAVAAFLGYMLRTGDGKVGLSPNKCPSVPSGGWHLHRMWRRGLCAFDHCGADLMRLHWDFVRGLLTGSHFSSAVDGSIDPGVGQWGSEEPTARPMGLAVHLLCGYADTLLAGKQYVVWLCIICVYI